MANLIIQGEPLVIFETQLDSWNTVIKVANTRPRRVKSWAHARGPLIEYQRKWREHGSDLAERFMRDVWWLTLGNPYLIKTRALVVVKVARATLMGESSETMYDVHNAYCKALFDGFTEAQIWKDDSWMHVPWVIYGWVHMSQLDAAFYQGMNTHVIEVYELDSVTFNDTQYILPDWS
jgi:hypothetical protein